MPRLSGRSTSRVRTQRAQAAINTTFTVGAVRFELPWRYRTLARVTVRVARWDLSTVDLVDPRSGNHLAMILPLDKEQNADGRRRVVTPAAPTAAVPAPTGIAPHLRQLIADDAATGLPPAYVPKDEPTAPLAELGEGDPAPDQDLR